MDFSFQNNYLQLKMLLMVKKKTILLGGGSREVTKQTGSILFNYQQQWKIDARLIKLCNCKK